MTIISISIMMLMITDQCSHSINAMRPTEAEGGGYTLQLITMINADSAALARSQHCCLHCTTFVSTCRSSVKMQHCCRVH
jgi:hypothetical protein